MSDLQSRNTTRSTRLRKATVTTLIGVGILGLAAFGWLQYAPKGLRRFDDAPVTVTISGAPAACKVSLRGEKLSHTVSCESVEEYFQNQLHLPRGTKYYFVDSGNSHRSELEPLVSKMRASGYPPVGTIGVFISEPAATNGR
jgi:hypothetical protein